MIDRALGATLLSAAIERHGGLDLWRRVRAIELRLDSLSGAVPAMKGIGRTFPSPGRIRIEPQRSRVIWSEWPSAGMCGLYEDGRVAIVPEVALAGGSASELGLTPRRQSFAGLRKWRRWQDLDALYFFGYALVHYLSLPFSLLDAELLSARRLNSGGGELWFRFDSDHTHCAVEGFRFDSSGLLVRHDYRADVISRMATGAHLSADYAELCGLPVARRRTVYAKLGHRSPAPVTPLPVLRASLEPLRVELAGG